MAGNDLESMLGSLLGGDGDGDGKGAGLLSALIGSLSHGQGGGSLGGLLDSLARSGLTAQKDSWIGTGTNRPVTGDQIQQALPDDTLQRVAEQAGVSPRNAADRIARELPEVVDRLTPEGEVPQASIEDLIRQQSG
ncbi:YidB family protein [Streptomyces sp. NPDC051105]|uniref:YidB family protein n=1 Tax=Streptomyces sp. NPDC051105 TaxID=3154843 RepID=UPI0034433DE6